jgi:predicted dehydrogenase
MIAYNSADELLSDKNVDIVVVAVPNHLHREYVKSALRAGKHVICEKPAAIHAWELEEMMAVAKETGKVLTIDQNRRVNRDFISMTRAIEAGLIGCPYVIESRVEGSRGMPEGWRTSKVQGGGMIYDWGVHLIDQIMYFCKEKVTEIYCKTFSIHYPEVDDNFRLTMTFEGGLVAHIEVSTNNFIKHPRFYVLGTEGTMVVNEWDGTGEIISPLSRENKWGVEIQQIKAGPSKTMAPRDPSTVKRTELTEPLGIEDNLDPTYRQLVDAIEGAPLKILPEEAYRVMQVIEAAFKSAQTGTAIKTDI